MHAIEPFLYIFLKEHTPESPSNEIALRYTTQAGCITIPPHYLKKYTSIFEHGFCH